jgi:hypothetical protein
VRRGVLLHPAGDLAGLREVTEVVFGISPVVEQPGETLPLLQFPRQCLGLPKARPRGVYITVAGQCRGQPGAVPDLQERGSGLIE